jgi:hypothetical protein
MHSHIPIPSKTRSSATHIQSTKSPEVRPLIMPKESSSVDFEDKDKAELMQSTSRDDLKDATSTKHIHGLNTQIQNQYQTAAKGQIQSQTAHSQTHRKKRESVNILNTSLSLMDEIDSLLNSSCSAFSSSSSLDSPTPIPNHDKTESLTLSLLEASEGNGMNTPTLSSAATAPSPASSPSHSPPQSNSHSSDKSKPVTKSVVVVSS